MVNEWKCDCVWVSFLHNIIITIIIIIIIIVIVICYIHWNFKNSSWSQLNYKFIGIKLILFQVLDVTLPAQ